MLRVNVTGDTMIFRKEWEGKNFYTTSLSKKKQDETYENAYISVQFKKDVVLHNKTKIKVNNGWLTFYMKGKEPVYQLFISDFEEEDEIPEGFTQVDEGLPF
jgi:hypothetical protein